MALNLKQFFLKKEYNDVYVNIDVVSVYDNGEKAEVFLSYWKDSSKTEKIFGDHFTVDFNKKSDVNMYTQAYTGLKLLPEFTLADDV